MYQQPRYSTSLGCWFVLFLIIFFVAFFIFDDSDFLDRLGLAFFSGLIISGAITIWLDKQGRPFPGPAARATAAWPWRSGSLPC